MLNVGESAPNPHIETHLGYQGPLAHFWKDGPLILFFYPKDNTTICTKEACTMQSSLKEFAGFRANVLGSSTDSLESHKAFAAENGLEFPLVADVKGELAKSYKAFRSLFRISKRVTYVINQAGVILGRRGNELSVNAHLDLIRETL